MRRTSIKNRIVNKEKKNPLFTKNTLLFVTLILLGLAGIVVIIFYLNDSTSMRMREMTYQFYLDTPVIHNEGASFSSEYMEIIENKDSLELDETPLYSSTSRRMYLPRNYGWFNVQPGGISYRIPEFTVVTNKGNAIISCKTDNKEFIISGGFLFDDSNNYIFLEYGDVTINNIRYDVSPLSFYSQSDGVFRVYDYDNNKIELIDYLDGDAVYKSKGGYQIKLNKGLYQDTNGDQFLIVSSPAVLDSIEKKGN